jgi:2-oxoglutarate ferredoxin oxidoreductase subunit delta
VLRIGSRANSKGYYFVEAAQPDQCIGCTLCGMVCPDIALKIYK